MKNSSSIFANLHFAYNTLNLTALKDSKDSAIPGLPFVFQASVAKKTKSKKKNNPSIPVNIALCLDHSGSMSGDPWKNMKKGVVQIINQARIGDRIAIVAYSDEATVVSNPVLIVSENDRRTLLNSVDAIPKPSGFTAFYAGMLKAAELIAPFTTKDRQSRVLILSDGCANRGPSTLDTIGKDVASLRSAGILVSTYGLGLNFAESFMTGVAKAGGGLAQYCKESEEIGSYFSTEYAILAKTIGHRAKLTLSGNGISVKDPVSDSTLSTVIDIPSIVDGGESVWVGYIPFDVLEKMKGRVEIDWKVEFFDFSGELVDFKGTSSFEIVKKGKSIDNPSEFVKARIAETQAARVQVEAARAMMEGNRSLAEKHIGVLRTMGMNNDYIKDVAENLSKSFNSNDINQFSKEALYASSTMSSRVVDSNDFGKSMEDKWGLKRGVQGSMKAENK